MHVALYFHGHLPAAGYGGTQRVVAWLARGLAELGHRVTLLAPRGSSLPEAETVPLDPSALRRPGFDLLPHLPRGLDVLHLHAPLPVPDDLPALHTQHGNRRMPTALRRTVYLSAAHARHHQASAFVHNGLDPSEFVVGTSKRSYDLFLGRLHRVKGYRWAIDGARAAGRRVVVAGGWRPVVRRGVRFVGEVGGTRKATLLSGAACLWMPALWEEPFGLTLIEALASGTPVLGTRRGALPEIVSDEVGALGDTLEDLVALRPRLDRIAPESCRTHVERHFTHRQMAAGYVRMYQGLLATGRLPAGRRWEERDSHVPPPP